MTRTTLNIDDDVLTTAQFLARQGGKTVGQVVSDLARRALKGSELDSSMPTSAAPDTLTPLQKKLKRLGLVPYKAPHGHVVTDDVVQAIKDSEGI